MDGVRLAILNKRFEAICRKMANTLFRTGRSGVLNTARDFSCCIVTADGDLLATAESLPIHVLSGPDLMAASMKAFHPDLARGDAFLHNSPYHGCSHPADHTILVPVIDDDGRHRFTVVAKAHQADCGNSVATTYHGAARDVYEEGALIFPAVQVQRGYETIDDIVRMCRMRIRVPEQWWGDFLAMLGAARVGERELLALAEETAWETLDRFAAEWFDYSERRMVDALQGLPAGSITVASTHDPLPGAPEGVRVNVSVCVDPAEARIAVDLRDNIDGSISETYAWSCRRGLKAGSRRWLLAEFHEMEPPQIAVQVLGGDAPEAAQEALDLAVAAVDRLDVHGPPDALAGGGVDALVTDIERRRDGRIATVGVGDQQRVRGEDRLQHLSDVVCVQRRQGMAEGRAGPVGGDQDRHLLAREAALAGLAAASARLAIQLPLPLAALENEGLIRLHDPGKPIRRLAHRREKAVAPAMRRARRNPAARGRRLDRLALGKRGAEGKPALLVVQPGQRRPRERSKGLPAALAPKPAQTARLAPRHRTAGAAMRAAPLLVDTQLDCRQRGRALRRVGQHRCNLLALRRRQLVDTRKPLPKALVIHLSDPKGKPETILSQCIQITN